MTDIGITFTYTSEEVKANVNCSQDMTCDDVIRHFVGFLAVAGYHNDSIIGCLEQVAEEYKDDDEEDKACSENDCPSHYHISGNETTPITCIPKVPGYTCYVEDNYED